MISSRAVILKISQIPFISSTSFIQKMHEVQLKESSFHQNIHTFCQVLSCQKYCKGKNSLLHTQALSFAKVLEPEELSPMITVSTMKRYLKNFSLPFEEGYTCLHLSCPFCAHVPGNVKEKCGTLYINKTTGMHICYSCCQLGSWQAFQDFINIKQIAKSPNKSQINLAYPTSFGTEIKGQYDEAKHLFEGALPFKDLDQTELENIIEKFKIMRLTLQFLTKYDVRISNDRNSLLLPLQRWDKKITAIKFLTYQPGENSGKLIESLLPRQSRIALFGFSQVARNQQEIVLTSTPFDAIAVNQETNIPAVTLPHGITTLPQELLPLLERFRKITLWFDNNMQEWEVAKMFSRKLGTKRCYFVRPKEDHPRPLTGLQNKLNLLRILKESKPISHQAITTFESLRQDIFEELKHSEQVAGIKWKRYTGLNKLLKGHRRGELTVFTGPTGSGKTTYMSEYSLDLCIQGVSTLWGSFEISNVRLGKMMLIQYSLCPLTKNLDKYDFWADKFQQLPMYFMTFRGQEAIKNVIDAMSHAVYVHDIQHVVVDNLQFMMGSDEGNSKMDRFWKQDLIVSAFRKFSTQHNCHVTLVVHPRKEQEEDELKTNSIYGGAKASQEADNILILQNKSAKLQKGKHIQVTKNRFDGDKGIIPLVFDKETLSFTKKKIKKTPTEENLKCSDPADVAQDSILKPNSS